MNRMGTYELMKFTIWFAFAGFWISLVVATTLLGADGIRFDVKRLIGLEAVVGWGMISGAGIGLVYDLLRHTWEPEIEPDDQQIPAKVVRKAA